MVAQCDGSEQRRNNASDLGELGENRRAEVRGYPTRRVGGPVKKLWAMLSAWILGLSVKGMATKGE